jgi:hypothetical protein
VELEHIELHKQVGMTQKRIEVLECEVAHKQKALAKIKTTEVKKECFDFMETLNITITLIDMKE